MAFIVQQTVPPAMYSLYLPSRESDANKQKVQSHEITYFDFNSDSFASVSSE